MILLTIMGILAGLGLYLFLFFGLMVWLEKHEFDPLEWIVDFWEKRM